MSLTIAPDARQIRGASRAQCKICGGETVLFDVVDFQKFCTRVNPYYYGLCGIPIYYLRCRKCGFIFTAAFDEWSTKDFARFIYNEEYVYIDGDYPEIRPASMAGVVDSVFSVAKAQPLLDYGSGSGVMAQKLRELCFTDVECFDPFSSPLRPSRKFQIVTCFEVIEHAASPHDFMMDLVSFLDPSAVVLFSTGLQPENIEEVRANWWYIAPRNAHIAIHNATSLSVLGQAFGLTFYCGADFHLFATGAAAGGAVVEQAALSIGAARV